MLNSDTLAIVLPNGRIERSIPGSFRSFNTMPYETILDNNHMISFYRITSAVHFHSKAMKNNNFILSWFRWMEMG